MCAEGGPAGSREGVARRAGVGVGTLYRHFPTRPDLIAAVFRQEIDACAAAAERLAKAHPAFDALRLWMREFVALVTTKRGLAQALHSGAPAFESMSEKRDRRLFPAFRRLFDTARSAGDIRGDVGSDDVLNAATSLCMSPATRPEQALAVVMLLVDGLRRQND